MNLQNNSIKKISAYDTLENNKIDTIIRIHIIRQLYDFIDQQKPTINKIILSICDNKITTNEPIDKQNNKNQC